MNKLWISLVVAVCLAAAFGKQQQDDYFPHLNSQGNMRFSYADSDYEISAFQETWDAAKYYCKLLGMELVSIETADEQNAITEATKNVNAGYWISLNNHFNAEKFIWESTGEYAESYTNWYEDNPNLYQEDYNCVKTGFPATNRSWFNNVCYSTSRYLCEKRHKSCSSN